jgi:hypothetical protein
MTTITERVAAGAALLDERLPGWADKIDLTRLDLSSDCNCILGQHYQGHPNPISRFGQVANSLCIPDADCELLGFFCARAEDGTPAGDAEYAALTAEWRAVIAARRGVAVA